MYDVWYFSLCDFSLSNFVNTRYLLLLLLLLTRLYEIIQNREGSVIDLEGKVGLVNAAPHVDEEFYPTERAAAKCPELLRISASVDVF